MLKLSGSFHDEGNHPHRRQPSRTCTWLQRRSTRGGGGSGSRPSRLRLLPSCWLQPALCTSQQRGLHCLLPARGCAVSYLGRRGETGLLTKVLLPPNILGCWECLKASHTKSNGAILQGTMRKHRPLGSLARSEQSRSPNCMVGSQLSCAGLTSISCGMFSETSPNTYPQDSVKLLETQRQSVKHN